MMLLVTILPSCKGCQPNLAIEVTNNTSETLFVYVVYHPPVSGLEETVGEIAPDSTIYKDLERNIVNATNITIEAKNEQDIIVFSRKYSRNAFLDAGMQVTITPKQ